MNKKPMSVFDQIMEGLQDSIAYSRGELELKETYVPGAPPSQGPKEILKLRKGLKMPQWIFAKTLNVSTKTVQGWEQGVRKPSQASLRLLQLIQTDPAIVRTIMEFPSQTRMPRLGKGAARK